MEHRRFIAFLDPFTGCDDTYEHNCFRDIYSRVMSLAREVGSDLRFPRFVTIYDTKHNDLPVCTICNNHGTIAVATSHKMIVVREPEVEA